METTDKVNRPTAKTSNRFVCIHGHFYQPPRENPWLERIEVQDSATPYHDWNERICAECYAPNTHARILDGNGRVENMINNYEWISFNVGPSLLVWLEQNAPRVLEAIQDADRKSAKRCSGFGNAIAQAFNHTILPLASKKDKDIQVAWGIEAFRHYFSRDPAGMWLPEAAVDTETLETLVDHGIRFTLLSPNQAARFRSQDSGEWFEVERKPLGMHTACRCLLPSGREISLFFYDGELAQQVAFQRLLSSGEQFRQRMLSRFNDQEKGPQLVHFATDGETFGHHHRFGEMALAYFISTLKDNDQVRITNYEEFLSLYPPVCEVEIVEKSSWSCAHGVERWRSDCGCRLDGEETHQQWRGPLREALDTLKENLDSLYEEKGRAYFSDPWEAFSAYGRVVLHRQEEAVHGFLQEMGNRALDASEVPLALKLLEMERHAQLMFTSCAWFFDDISGIESVQVLRFAARAIQLAERNFSADVEEAFLKILEQAPSNDEEIGNGRRLWEAEVKPSTVDLERVLAHFAVSALFQDERPSQEGLAYSKKDLDGEILEAGQVHFGFGAAEITSCITLEAVRHTYAVIHFGGLDVQFFWRPYEGDPAYQSLRKELVALFQEGSLGDLYQKLLKHFRGPTHRLKDLFLDEQRRVVEMWLMERVNEYRAQFGQLYDKDSALLKQLGLLKFPIPEPIAAAARVSTNSRIWNLVNRLKDEEDLQSLSQLLEQAKQWGYKPKAARWERILLMVLEKRIRSLRKSGNIPDLLEGAACVLRAAEILAVPLNLWNAQNLFIEVCRKREKAFGPHGEAVRSFASRINMSPKVLPPGLREPD